MLFCATTRDPLASVMVSLRTKFDFTYDNRDRRNAGTSSEPKVPFQCYKPRLIGEHFKAGATRPFSQFASPAQFAFPDTNERRSAGVGH